MASALMARPECFCSVCALLRQSPAMKKPRICRASLVGARGFEPPPPSLPDFRNLELSKPVDMVARWGNHDVRRGYQVIQRGNPSALADRTHASPECGRRHLVDNGDHHEGLRHGRALGNGI